MIIKVKLFGKLRKSFPDYEPDQAVEIEIPDGGHVKDLLSALNVSNSDGYVILIDGRIKGVEDELHENADITILEALQGG